MKVWFGIAMITLFAVIFINSGNGPRDDHKAPSAALLDAPSAPARPVAVKASVVAGKPRHHAAAVTDTVETPAPEAAPAPLSPVAEEPSPDLPKWSPQVQENSILELRNFQADQKVDRPLIMVTYGDAPIPNMRIEHREASDYGDPRSTTKASVVASGDE